MFSTDKSHFLNFMFLFKTNKGYSSLAEYVKFKFKHKDIRLYV